MKRYTKAMRQADLIERLDGLGFSRPEQFALLRIERTLQRWGERECGDERGCITRDDETGKPYWQSADTGKRFPMQDREAGAKRRLAGIMKAHPELIAYHQSDCRGCNLYVLRRADVGEGESVDCVYTRGVAVCG